jgi:hypothetical protein
VFDETNGSQREQADRVEIDEEEVPSTSLKNMPIGDMCP